MRTAGFSEKLAEVLARARALPQAEEEDTCPECGVRKGHTETCWLVDRGETRYDRDGKERE